jgi:tRNA(Ile)-lysidine synthase
VLEFRQNPTRSGTADVGLGLRTYLEGDHFYLAEWGADLPLTHWPQIFREVDVSIPGDYALNLGWTMQVKVFDGREMDEQVAFQNQDSDSAWLELGEQFPHIKLRVRLSGDRFSPLGMNGKSMTLSDYMVNQKIPRRARDHWPLVCIGGEIAWVVRHHLAHPFRITKATKQILHLKLIKSEEQPRG